MPEDIFGVVGTTQAGAYRVEAVVAEGGFGVVYRAYHDAFQAPVALKCLKIPQRLGPKEQDEFLRRFREEAALLFRLSASLPAVVRPLHVDKLVTENKRFVPFMALEWLDGEGLDQVIMRRAEQHLPCLGLNEAVNLLAPVARTLARAHHFPGPDGPIAICHRDLKPDNIFLAQVNGESVVKIFDFGIAKVRNVATQVAGRHAQTADQSAFTPGYGAPEQWLPRRFGQTGPWTDVWGLALTVLEVALGRPIIDGDGTAMMGTACDERRRPTPRAEGMEVPDIVEAVFLRALAVDPRDRYTEAGAFWDDLEEALGLEPSSAPAVGTARGSTRRDRPKSDPLPDPRGGDALELELPSLLEATLPQSPRQPPSSSPSSPRPVSPRSSSLEMELTLESPSPLKSVDLPSPPPAPAAPPPDLDVTLESPLAAKPAPKASKPLPPAGLDVQLSAAEARASEPKKRAPAPVAASGRHAPMSEKEALAMVRDRAGARPSPYARIRVPLGIGAVGVVLAIASFGYAQQTGQSLDLGPVHVTWLAGGLLLAGVVLVMQRLIFQADDDG